MGRSSRVAVSLRVSSRTSQRGRMILKRPFEEGLYRLHGNAFAFHREVHEEGFGEIVEVMPQGERFNALSFHVFEESLLAPPRAKDSS